MAENVEKMLTFEEYVAKNTRSLAPIFFEKSEYVTKEQFLADCYNQYVKNYLLTHVGKNQRIEEVYGVSITNVIGVSSIKSATKYITLDITFGLSNGKQIVGNVKFNTSDLKDN